MQDDATPLERDPLALAMIAAWLNVETDKLPQVMQAHTCEQTRIAWRRVGEAARKHFMEEAAGIAERHREPGEQSEVWFKGWNAACEHLAELFRDIDKPMPEPVRAAGEPK